MDPNVLLPWTLLLGTPPLRHASQMLKGSLGLQASGLWFGAIRDVNAFSASGFLMV